MKIHRVLRLVICFCALVRTATATMWYVATNGNDSAAGTSWVTAKSTIQAAIDMAASNDTVLVSNGVYATGGRVVYGALSNRVAITNSVTVRSVNGPAVTIIQGAGPMGNNAVRCVYVGTNAVLEGFTLTNGATRSSGNYDRERHGGGIWCESSGMLSDCVLTGNSASYGGGSSYGTLYHCTLTGNSASYGGGAYDGTLYHCTFTGNSADRFGGGAYDGTLYHCTLTGNSASAYGGGAYDGTLYHCTLTGNSASYGGGASYGTLYHCTLTGNSASNGGGVWYGTLYNSTLTGNSASDGGGACGGMLYNCIVYYNTAARNPNFLYSTLNYSCAMPNPDGSGNITNDPQFVNAAMGNYRLSANSPCRDKGNNAYTQETTDLDGNPRIVKSIVDMGAYEFQVLADYWTWASAITNGLTNIDQCTTGDGYPNLLKYATGSSPTNSDNLARLNRGGVSNEWFSLRFNRNTNATDVTLLVEGAYAITNHATWHGVATNVNGSWGDATNVAEMGATNPVTVTVHDTVAAATNRFMRLRVMRP